MINWAEVTKKYSGLLISPYIEQAKLEYFWYSRWDCASACIWDLSQVRLIDAVNF